MTESMMWSGGVGSREGDGMGVAGGGGGPKHELLMGGGPKA